MVEQVERRLMGRGSLLAVPLFSGYAGFGGYVKCQRNPILFQTWLLVPLERVRILVLKLRRRKLL